MQKWKSYARFIDIYGHEVKLLYRGEETKKTLPGALMTIVSVGLILWYFAL